MDLKGKKVLLMGLGILGGGVATARFLAERGALLTVTDMKSPEYLKPSLEKLQDLANIKYVLGWHEESDFLECDILVINPDVSVKNKFVELARGAGKQIENELTLFYRFCPSEKIVAITGTRGKTTTTNWAYHLLKSFKPNTVLAGNSEVNPFLAMVDKCNPESFVVLEVPSYHLELEVANLPCAPKVAIITNIYRDHLARHITMQEYARVKGNIFKYQNQNDFLILNKDNEWTEFLLGLKPKAQVLFAGHNPIWSENELLEFGKIWGGHNVQNLLASSFAALKMGVPEDRIKNSIANLPSIKFRQEKVFENEKLAVYNDTSATSPEAVEVALDRFVGGERETILIAGGTDRELEYGAWAKKVREKMNLQNLILLSGSATEKMKRELGSAEFNEFDTLEECLARALEKATSADRKAVILFSPGAKSFEKFKNEFDRGEQFNLIVKKLLQ